MARHWTNDKPLSEPRLPSSMTHICGTRGRWVYYSWLIVKRTLLIKIRWFYVKKKLKKIIANIVYKTSAITIPFSGWWLPYALAVANMTVERLWKPSNVIKPNTIFDAWVAGIFALQWTSWNLISPATRVFIQNFVNRSPFLYRITLLFRVIRVLGIALNDSLKFDFIFDMCKKAYRRINALKRISKFVTQNSRKSIYRSFIAANFNYCPISYIFSGKKYV